MKARVDQGEADMLSDLIGQGIAAWTALPSQWLAASAAAAAWQMDWLTRLGAVGLSAFQPGGAFDPAARFNALTGQALAEAEYLMGDKGGAPPFPD